MLVTILVVLINNPEELIVFHFTFGELFLFVIKMCFNSHGVLKIYFLHTVNYVGVTKGGTESKGKL